MHYAILLMDLHCRMDTHRKMLFLSTARDGIQDSDTAVLVRLCASAALLEEWLSPTDKQIHFPTED